MKNLMCGATALMLLSASAFAQETNKTLEPNQLTVEKPKAPLQLNEQQRTELQSGLVAENTEQKAPPKFEPKVGDTIPLSIALDVMPPRLVTQDPSLEPFGYAKLAKQVLVIDPMKKTIIDILPRAEPTSGKDVAPADWAATTGRPLIGQAPQAASGTQSPEPAGDSGDKSNGNEKNANQK